LDYERKRKEKENPPKFKAAQEIVSGEPFTVFHGVVQTIQVHPWKEHRMKYEQGHTANGHHAFYL